jgi:hypothetical protein
VGQLFDYSFDIDFVSGDGSWVAGNYPPEVAFYLWGPAVPDWFVLNTEASVPELAQAASTV